MIRPLLLFSLRRLKRQPVATLVNILGLGAAMAVTLMILTLIGDQRSYDRYNPDADRIVRIVSEQLPPDENLLAAAPAYVATALAADVPEVERAMRLAQIRADAEAGGRALGITGIHADDDFLDFFAFPLVEGDPATALTGPGHIVLTEQTADRFFGDRDPMGKMMTLEGFGEYLVTGVVASSRVKSHLRFDVVASFASLESRQPEAVADPENFWHFADYVRLRPGVDPSILEPHLARYSERYSDPAYRLRPQRLTDIVLGPIMGNEIAAYNLPGFIVWVLLGLAGVVLGAAVFNYVGLSVAQSVQRGREVGVRKALGAGLRQLRMQYLSESLLTALGALLFGTALLFVLVPATNRLSFLTSLGIHIDFSTLAQPWLVVAFVGTAFVVGLLAGVYPAYRLARFEPSVVLRGDVSAREGSAPRLRRGLAFVQLVLSFLFVITSILLYRQFSHMLEARSGFAVADRIVVPLLGNDPELLATELGRYSEIVDVGAASRLPAADGDTSTEAVVGTDTVRTDYLVASSGFVRALDLAVVAGEGADVLDADTPAVIVNETATRRLGFDTPGAALGTYIRIFGADRPIRGVVRDFRTSIMAVVPGPLVILDDPGRYQTLLVAHRPGTRDAAVARVRELWERVDQRHAFEWAVYKDRVTDNQFMRVFRDQLSIVGLVTLIALLVACLGLLTMISFAAARRTREIGIRKVLGATIPGIMWLLSKEFLAITAAAAAVGVPAAYLLNRLWLDFFYDHVTFGAGLLGGGVLVVLILVTVTVGSLAMRAAAADPAASLRSE